MCGGLSFQTTGISTETSADAPSIIKKVFFPMPQAQIPVLLDEGLAFRQWGKRRGEDDSFDVPQTGWARLDSIEAGKWSRYAPSQVLIPARSFMEKDEQKQSHWFQMPPNAFLLGLHIMSQDKSFVYIVTQPAEGAFQTIHERWPLVVDATMQPLEQATPTALAGEAPSPPPAHSRSKAPADPSIQMKLF
jgi:putative SOS response-associated peptidase YedK